MYILIYGCLSVCVYLQYIMEHLGLLLGLLLGLTVSTGAGNDRMYEYGICIYNNVYNNVYCALLYRIYCTDSMMFLFLNKSAVKFQSHETANRVRSPACL